MRLRPQSKQEMFDWACQYFKEAPVRCFSPGHGCRYLREDGHRCVIGSMFVPETGRDADFMVMFFGPISEIVFMARDAQIQNLSGMDWMLYSSDAITLATAIQSVHDRTSHWDEPYGLNDSGWERLAEIAAQFGLNLNVYEEVRRGW